MTKLVEEMEDNEDDIFLAPDLTDSDSGAALSVISYIQWLLTSSQSPMPDFDYLLITQDSSFVAVDKLWSRLRKSMLTQASGGNVS